MRMTKITYLRTHKQSFGLSFYLARKRLSKKNKDENDVLFSTDTGKLGKINSECSYQEYNLRPSDALPLSYRRLVGAKAIKLGSWDKHPAYC